jgi:hypothetical protein
MKQNGHQIVTSLHTRMHIGYNECTTILFIYNFKKLFTMPYIYECMPFKIVPNYLRWLGTIQNMIILRLYISWDIHNLIIHRQGKSGMNFIWHHFVDHCLGHGQPVKSTLGLWSLRGSTSRSNNTTNTVYIYIIIHK